ncbi:type I-MYXAN CRISPR-associated Cas8a1/Cmx1 [Singulisphaera sp. Ch08]|uniref:Type I-MYXAN CRISPR-associated Cas8a1/Cmx1 n=1 Tax=Singulisphaera sp. Ch08 TaxID=3120278 RepID=A0AAU7CJ32_9BACT
METLSIDLFAPGMSPLHRAGLGGLAATLKWIDDKVKGDRRPPGDWSVDDRQVELRWENSNGAKDFLKRLYELAFQIDENGLIHLPGSYGNGPPKPEVLAELQQGMSLTILQFGPNRKSDGVALKSYEIDNQTITIQHQKLTGYTHQSEWEKLVTGKGTLKPHAIISGTIAPGFVQRHVAFPSTTIEQPPGLAIALHFALIGTLSLAIDRKTGVLLVPDVKDLNLFVRRRGLMTPKSARDCRIASPADAALQTQVRLQLTEGAQKLKTDRCLAVLFATKAWNEKQKARASVLDIEPDTTTLERFDLAMHTLQARIALTKPTKKGEAPVPFWAESVIRPLVAENLARDQPWYQDFRRLVVSPDGSDDAQKVRQLGFEKKGLQAMVNAHWEDRGEEAIVRSVHEAMFRRYGMIRDETAGNQTAFNNRADRQMQRWRLAFAGAKTADDFRKALTDLWSRSGSNPVLKSSWREVLPLICDEDRWRLARDLALLALASYERPVSAPKDVDSVVEKSTEV